MVVDYMFFPLNVLFLNKINKQPFLSYRSIEKEESSSPLQPMTKQVSFSNIAHVVLIPSREEYDKLRDSLWYNRSDYARFINNVYTKVY